MAQSSNLIETPEQRLLAFKSKQSQLLTSSLSPADQADFLNPQSCSDFASAIFQHCLDIEGQTQPKADYMQSRQMDVHEKMRSILVDWLVDVHYKFKLVPETLYLTINLIDRYLEKEQVTR